jgi:hypothetical protein
VKVLGGYFGCSRAVSEITSSLAQGSFFTAGEDFFSTLLKCNMGFFMNVLVAAPSLRGVKMKTGGRRG